MLNAELAEPAEFCCQECSANSAGSAFQTFVASLTADCYTSAVLYSATSFPHARSASGLL